MSLVRGGPSQAVLEAVGALRRLGVDAEIATTNDDGPEVLDVPIGILTCWQGAPVHFFRRFSPTVRPVREFAFSVGLTTWLWKHIQDYDLMHVHALFSYSSSAAMLVARAKRVPFLNRPSGLLCRWSLQQSPVRKRAFLRLFDRANLNASAALEYTADQEKEESRDVGLRAPAVVLPYGLHLPLEIADARARLRRQLQLAPDEPIVLFMSRLHVKKGLDTLIEALEKLASRRFTLVVAGRGAPDYELAVRTRACAGPLRDRTHFLGFVQGEFKQLLLQGADLFALPSFSESFAIVVMEAIAAGTPVVTTPGVPLAVLIEKFDLGWVAPPNPGLVASALDEALSSLKDPDAGDLRRARSRSLAERNFSWETIARRLTALYEAVLTRKPLPSFELSSVAL